MEFYTLKHRIAGKFMGLRILRNPEDSSNCNDTHVRLVMCNFPYERDYPLYIATTKEDAERVSNQSEKWYNTTTNNPENDYAGELEVVKFTMEI